MPNPIDFGWLDVCLAVNDVRVSREFYEGLGFRKVEGEDTEGWAVVVRADARIGLYSREHMAEIPFSLNFRGGDIGAITTELKDRGYRFDKESIVRSKGSGSAVLKDPDGHVLFFDTAAGELKKT